MNSTGAPAAHDIFTNNERWGDLNDWNRSALALHQQGGIHRIEREGFQPFWALIDHGAMLEVERNHEVFTNEPESVLVANAAIEARQLEIKTLIHMDPPQHGKYRRLTNDWFKPASVRRLNDRLDELSREAVAKMEALGGECDFAVDIALPFPLQVILKILGLPESDYDRMLLLTQQLFGSEDPDCSASHRAPRYKPKCSATSTPTSPNSPQPDEPIPATTSPRSSRTARSTTALCPTSRRWATT